MLNRLSLAILAVLALALMLAPASVSAVDLFKKSCESAPGSTICTQAEEQKGKDNPVIRIIKDASTVIAVLAGVAAVVVIILSGISMITSAGNSDTIQTARRRIIYALIGIAIISLSWTITRYVVDVLL